MATDEIRDVRAEWDHLEALSACVLERRGHEAGAEAAALVPLVDLGVRERDAAGAAMVGDEPDRPLAEPELVTRLVGDVDDLGLLR
jgi:hypothetical protein